MSEFPESSLFLIDAEIETILFQEPGLADFWAAPGALLIFRSRPCRQDPIYEIQLAFDLGDRLETYCWLWVDALAGEILRRFPES